MDLIVRKHLHIDLHNKGIVSETRQGEDLVRTGRYLIAKTLVEKEIGKVDPLSPQNLLIFSAGPFAGTNFSNINRISVGCKSPLTGGVKEANAGGTFALALGHLAISGITLYEAAKEWVVIHITREGSVAFDPADAYLGKSNFEAAELLHEKYGKKVSLALCGPVGEYQGLLAGIGFSDVDRRPSRIAARGGVGAVMGSKKVKAIVVDLDKMPALHDRKKLINAVREYADKLSKNDIMAGFRDVGTASMADHMNHMGGLPVRNFSNGRLVDTNHDTFKMGGDYIRQQNIRRGGEPTHACMPGCVIQCSNIYADEQGNEIVSPVEYETIGLMGSNCGLTDPDDLARLNFVANDLGIDTIEAGAMLAVLMDAGLAEFGDVEFMFDVLDEIRRGTEKGKLWAQGTARVGEHYKCRRVPAIKGQAISAYDPRVVEVTGISMMVTAQGADHTTGNVPYMDCTGKSVDELVTASMNAQVETAALDALNVCIFGRSETATNIEFITNAINSAVGTELQPSFFHEMGRDTLKYEEIFNETAGFNVEDNELPEFFYTENLAPANKVARFHGAEVQECINKWWQEHP